MPISRPLLVEGEFMPKRKTRRQTPNYQSFYVQVDNCEPSYSFSLNDSRHFEGPYSEYLDITFNGAILAPRRVKGRRVSLVFLGRRDEQRMATDPTNSAWVDWRALCVGTLTIRGERTNFLGSLPYDAVWALSRERSSGAFRIIHLYGSVERGRVAVRSIHFSRDVDPEDSPE
jgi:hypothetical protein